MSEETKEHRAGFVALMGRPNVGKSTLLNRLLGEKLAITADKPQTTRHRILGVLNVPAPPAQVVLVDTPGLHRPGKSRLNRFMVDEARKAGSEVDAVALVVDVPQRKKGEGGHALGQADLFVLDELREVKGPLVLVINKVDLLRDKRHLLPIMEAWQAAFAEAGRPPPVALVPLSAQSGDGVEVLVGELVRLLPVGPPLFPPDVLTDRAERFLVAELVREQLFHLLSQELPYSVTVSIDDWQERPPKQEGERGVVVIEATIHVAKEAHKRIVVGERGRMVRDVGARSRFEIERLLDTKVHLSLFVRVDEGWTESERALRELGYDSDA